MDFRAVGVIQELTMVSVVEIGVTTRWRKRCECWREGVEDAGVYDLQGVLEMF